MGMLTAQISGIKLGSKFGNQLALFQQISSPIFPGEGIQTSNFYVAGNYCCGGK
jgi:hypothetical protein